jgi:hypothetical protein
MICSIFNYVHLYTPNTATKVLIFIETNVEKLTEKKDKCTFLLSALVKTVRRSYILLAIWNSRSECCRG